MSSSADSPPTVLLIALSGPSCSGKTTLARLIRDALSPRAFIVHQDDFYKTDAEIPVHNGVQDWDCAEAIDIPLFENALRHVKDHGKLPGDFVSKEDSNAVGEVPGLDADTLQIWEKRAGELLRRTADGVAGAGATGAHGNAARDITVAIVDGFLLFAPSIGDIRHEFDLKLFLRADYNTVKTRREARKGYVTLEGFWEDPPGYVDKIVWPNYVKDHCFLFEEDDVGKSLDEDVCVQEGVLAVPKEGIEDFNKAFEWAMGAVPTALEEILFEGGEGGGG